MSDKLRQLTGLIRQSSKTVDAYLDYTQKYAALSADIADEAVDALLPGMRVCGDRLVAKFELSKVRPSDLHKVLEEVAKKAVVDGVIVCRATATVYVFGPEEQPTDSTSKAPNPGEGV